MAGTCADINECTAGTDDCDGAPVAPCTNTTGSFTCSCPGGFAGTGRGASGCLYTDPSLVSLVPSAGTLSPAFVGATTMYTLTLPADTASMTLTPSVAFPAHATIRVNGSVVPSGSASASVIVSAFAPTPLTIVVTTDSGATRTYTVVVRPVSGRSPMYVKASNTDAADYFGYAIALSADGSTLAVGAHNEDSSATGVGGDQTSNAASTAGAVYIYTRAGAGWSQQAYVKGSNTDAGDAFGLSLALSADGATLAVAAFGEDSNATGIGGDQSNNSASDGGAVYVYSRAGTAWSQQAYVKASNTGAGDRFGTSLALSADGATLAVGADHEASSATGIGGNQTNNDATSAGAVYLYSRAGATWSQQAYVKSSNTDAGDYFGVSLALSADGSTLAVGAYHEASSATGIGGDQANDSASWAGAVYVYTRVGATWSQQAYVKASNTGASDRFGSSVALSADGATLAVGAVYEDSNATGIGGDQSNNSASDGGAVYVYIRSGVVWTQQAYVKASNTGTGDQFGWRVAVSADGSTLAVSAPTEDSNATGIGGNQTNNSASEAGAVYVYTRAGAAWSPQAYVKASNTGAGDWFGSSLALSADGATTAVGAFGENSNATGIGGDQTNNTASGAGAVYVY
jgi:hypothetical protein